MLRAWKVRTGMIAVAVIAVAIGGFVMLRRASDFRLKAEKHRSYAQAYQGGWETFRRAARRRQELAEKYPQESRDARRQRHEALFKESRSPGDEFVARLRSDREEFEAAAEARDKQRAAKMLKEAQGFSAYADLERSRAAYHSKLGQKYEWAAAHPWFSVPPDPPLPGEEDEDSSSSNGQSAD